MVLTAVNKDAELKKEVSEQLAWDARIDAADITVSVDRDSVTLSGSVPSYASRVFAEADVGRIAGVKGVINELAIKFPAVAEVPGDRQIEERIRNLVRMNAGIDESRIDIEVVDGTAILEGTVPSFWQKVRIEAMAAETAGVMGINNKISVVPTREVMDEVIAQEITASVDRTIDLDIDRINVEVADGVVTLGGIVPDCIAQQAAEEIAQRTNGVRAVKNDLVIERSRQD